MIDFIYQYKILFLCPQTGPIVQGIERQFPKL